MNSGKLEVGGRISINNMWERKGVCYYVRGVFGGAEEEFPMACNRKGHCGEMRAWGTWCNMGEIGCDMELKEIRLLDSSKYCPILQVIPDLWNVFFKTFYILLRCLWKAGLVAPQAVHVQNGWSTPNPDCDLQVPQFLFLSYGASLVTETGVIPMTGGASGFATMGASQGTLARSQAPSRKAALYVNCSLWLVKYFSERISWN